MEHEPRDDVVVIGGGVIGPTTTVVPAESGALVRRWAREPAERTTSALAGALWWPCRIGPDPLAGGWTLASLVVYGEPAARPEETGVRLVEGVHHGVRLDERGRCAAREPGLRTREAAGSVHPAA
ncbi:hypothetical protein ACIPSA_14125 [Streptomyces sp. NPDC086549]|uniref:hypothetical protein n=1 Tax=Streptomyces sp. NPDC086549 TaxID=3365752 RepID=UPI003825D8D7